MTKLLLVALAALTVACNANEIADSLHGLLEEPVPAEKALGACPVPLGCPSGWTGHFCDIRLCDSRGIVALPHPDRGFPIDYISFSDKCAGGVRLPVDSHITDLFVYVDGKDNGANPMLKLYDSSGNVVAPYATITNDTKTIVLQYDMVGKAGHYSAQFSASMPCIYQAHANTEMIVPLGFTSGRRAQHNDHAHASMYAGDFSYAIAHARRLPRPGYVRAFDLYANSELLHGYDPSYRFGCGYEMVFGPMTCVVGTNYYYKMHGIDENGYDFMRTDLVSCKDGMFTTTPGPSTTTPGPCEHGGVFEHGQCTCVPTWSGKYCHDIVCFNGGSRTDDNICMCPANFVGPHCGSPMCNVQSLTPIFTPNLRSMAFVIQNTKSMADEIHAIKEYITSILEDQLQNHPKFIIQYSLHIFDDNLTTTDIVSSDPIYIMEYIHHIVPSTAEGQCNKQGVLGLIHALANSLPWGTVYLITDSPNQNNLTEQLAMLHLLGLSKAKVNVFLTAPRCANDTDLGYRVYEEAAILSGGQFFRTQDTHNAIFQLLQTVQTAYQDTKVEEMERKDCTKKTSLQIHMDSHSPSFTVAVHGMKPQVQLFSPDGKAYNTTPLISDDGVAMVQAITPCPNGWVQYEHNCYLGFTRKANWRDAQTNCRSMGGSLVSVLNQEKSTFLEGELSNLNYWIGLNDIEIEGAYYWDSPGDDTALPLGHWFTNWADGQPDDGSHTKNCAAVMHKDGKAGQWMDQACTNQMAYICQRHAYDEDDHRLPSGVWRADFMTASGGCRVDVHAQSNIQVYHGFDVDMFGDFPKPEPFNDYENNHIIANVSNLFGDGAFGLAQFYGPGHELLSSNAMLNRKNCSYDYVSEAFACPRNTFMAQFTGTDEMDMSWTRIRPVICFNATEAQSASEATRAILSQGKIEFETSQLHAIDLDYFHKPSTK